MDRHLQMPKLAARVRGRPIAAYRSLRGAALATQRLDRAGHDRGDITVRPVLLDADRAACRCLPDEGDQRRAAAIAGAVIGLVGALLSAGEISPIALLAGAFASVAAAMVSVGVVIAWRARVARRIERAGRGVRARAFEVVVEGDSDRAEHELATWWDPDAQPVTVSR